jgi:Lipid A 3-O-deacylase (PagL)
MKIGFRGRFTSSLAIAIFTELLLFDSGVCDAAENSAESAEESAEESLEPVLQTEIGATMVRGSAVAAGASVRWPEAGPRTSDWECGLFLISEYQYTRQQVEATQPTQAIANCLLVGHVVRRWVDFGVGPAYLQNTDFINGSHFNFALLARLRPTERLTVSWRHWSNAGSVKPNLGRDVLLVGWSF